jgi:hypothetical protein
LKLRCGGLPDGVPLLGRPDAPHAQRRLPPGPESVWSRVGGGISQVSGAIGRRHGGSVVGAATGDAVAGWRSAFVAVKRNTRVQGVSPCLPEFLKKACGANAWVCGSLWSRYTIRVPSSRTSTGFWRGTGPADTIPNSGGSTRFADVGCLRTPNQFWPTSAKNHRSRLSSACSPRFGPAV